jgi:membrane protein DedA with SNARE-associated domain
MKSWVKGGLIGGGIGLLLLILLFIFSDASWAGYLAVMIVLPLIILYSVGITSALESCIFSDASCGGLRILISILIWSLLGALISWLIGKLKKKPILKKSKIKKSRKRKIKAVRKRR